MNNEKFEIIPAIDLLEGQCVRLQQGDYDEETIYSEDPPAIALRWQQEGATRLHLVDLDGAKEGYLVNLAVVSEITKSVDIPCELGGGIRCPNDVKEAFECGVERIILGTAASEYPEFVKMVLKEFGQDKVVVSIDAKEGKVRSRGWIEETGIDAGDLAMQLSMVGINRFIYTDITTDGMLKGPNFPAIAAFCDRVPDARIIAAGGVSSVEDVQKLIAMNTTNLEGAVVGKALYDGYVTLPDLLTATGTTHTSSEEESETELESE